MIQEIPAHPFKSRLRSLKVNQFQAARFLGISQALLNQKLLGYRPFALHEEEKLAALIEKLESDQGDNHARADQ